MMWLSAIAINGLAAQLHPLITPPYRAGALPHCAFTAHQEQLIKICKV